MRRATIDGVKRWVICFDGTWKRGQDQDVSNIEKLARTISNEDSGSQHPQGASGAAMGPVQQTVYYVGGVGASYKVDRVLGGALGLGLSNNLMSAYRFLALNYSPGDTVYVFGFSRGAFTARSLVGMIVRVGLVRADGLIHGSLRTAQERYETYRDAGSDRGDTAAEFRRDFCHDHVCLPFLGVFDTVEALGPKARFHQVDFLADAVAVGRQALGIDEQRRVFCPRLWTGDPSLGAVPAGPSRATSPRVKQVWFEGVHSDVGGGYPETGLSDTTLLWMAAEATRQGLAFDDATLSTYLDSGSPARRHNSLKPAYRATNLLLQRPSHLAPAGSFRDGLRVLEPDQAVGVSISSSALDHEHEGTYQRASISEWLERHSPATPVEPVLAFPELDADRIASVLAVARADALRAGGREHDCPSPGCTSGSAG